MFQSNFCCKIRTFQDGLNESFFTLRWSRLQDRWGDRPHVTSAIWGPPPPCKQALKRTTGQQRVKRKRDHAKRRNIHVRQIWHLMDRFYPLEENDEKDFQLRFRLFSRSAVDFDAASSNCFWFYTTGTFEEVIGDLFGVSVFATCTVIQKVSRAIAKRPKHILSFPEKLADTEREFYKIVSWNKQFWWAFENYCTLDCPPFSWFLLLSCR